MRRARLNPPVLYRQLLSLAMIALAAVLAGLMFDALVALGASARAAFGDRGAPDALAAAPHLLGALLHRAPVRPVVLRRLLRGSRLRDTRGARAVVVAGLPDRIPVPAARAQHRPDDSADGARAPSAARSRASTRSRPPLHWEWPRSSRSGPASTTCSGARCCRTRTHGSVSWPGWAVAWPVRRRPARLVCSSIRSSDCSIYAPVYAVALWGARALHDRRDAMWRCQSS